MWADAQRDGRPVEYRWRLLFNAAKFGWRPLRKFHNSIPCTTPQRFAEATAGVPCSNAATIGTQDVDAKWILHMAKLRQGQEPPKMHIQYISPGDGQTSCKVRLTINKQQSVKRIWMNEWMTSVERRRCSNEAKTRKPLKFAGVPQTRQSISAASGPPYHENVCRRYCCLRRFCRLSIYALVAKI